MSSSSPASNGARKSPNSSRAQRSVQCARANTAPMAEHATEEVYYRKVRVVADGSGDDGPSMVVHVWDAMNSFPGRHSDDEGGTEMECRCVEDWVGDTLLMRFSRPKGSRGAFASQIRGRLDRTLGAQPVGPWTN